MSFFNPFRGTPSKAATKPAAQLSTAGSPLELINYDTESGKFHLGQEAIHVLRNVKGPVGVVAVCGRARQGKSFILNQLLGQSTGFVVAPTHRPCTKGLWMWSTPVERVNADGSKYHLVLLDTEGIDAYDQTGQYSTQIFSLAVLLSSLFVYNQMGGIDEAALDRLSLVTEMTKHIRVRAGAAAGEGEAELADFTPAFLWLLRDFYLSLEEEGRQLTPREYLETALSTVEGRGAAIDAKNNIRESIKNLFPNRDCFCLVRPMSDENQLTKLETIPPSQMRPQFVEGIKRLTRLIFMRAQPKRLGTQILSGPMLAALAEAYVQAINHGAVPTIATAWQGVAEAECRRSADAAEEAYKAAFNKSVASEEAAMDAEHQRCMALARRTFSDTAIGEEVVKRANKQRYTERLEALYREYKQQRLASAESECRKLISNITTRLTQMANKEGTTLEEIQRELSSWEANYDAAPGTQGPAKWRLHAEFMQGTYSSIVRGVVQKQEQAAKAERLAAAQKASEFERRLQQEQSQMKSAAAQHAQEQSAAQKRIQTLESEVVHLKQQLEAARREASAAQQEATGSQRQLQDRLAAAEAEAAKARQSGDRRAAVEAELARARGLQEKTAVDLSVKEAELVKAREALDTSAAEIADLQKQLATRQSAPTAMETDDNDAGYGTPDEDATAHITPIKMTINEMKDWLTEHGHENIVWDLTQSKAKKPRYIEEMNKVLGR